MDRIDRQILKLLQNDASISNVDLANRVGLAPSSCLRRVRKLWNEGIIKRSIVITDAEKMGKNLKAIVSVKLAEHSNQARKNWVASLKRKSAVVQAYTVSGEQDIILFLSLTNMKEFKKIDEELLGGDPNVIQYITQFILEEIKFDLTN